jgi:hypothetical protein
MMVARKIQRKETSQNLISHNTGPTCDIQFTKKKKTAQDQYAVAVIKLGFFFGGIPCTNRA